MSYIKLSESLRLMDKLKTYSDPLPQDENLIESLFCKVARNNLKSFGEKLKEARQKNGYSQVALSSRLNVRQASFSEWENGKNFPRLPCIKELLEVYNLDPADLIDSNPEKPSNNSFVPLVDNSLFTEKRYEDFKHKVNLLTDAPKIPVVSTDKLSFAYRIPDSSMHGGNKPIFENSVLLFSTNGLDKWSLQEQALFCDNKVCIINICAQEPLVRLVKYDSGVLSLIALNTKWRNFCFPDDNESEKKLDNQDACIYKGHKTYSSSVQIFGILKKMYVDF